MSQWSQGRVVWRELITPDPDASARFYGDLLGWSVREMPMPDGVYRMWLGGGQPIGGMTRGQASHAHWLAYVSVPDVDAAALRARELGARLEGLPYPVGSAGRVARILDPQGASIAAWRSASGDGDAAAPSGAGQFCWEELASDDLAAAAAFYGALFGWTTRARAGMTVFASGAREVASIIPANGASRWLSYVVVPKIFDALQQTRRLGGAVVVESMRLPAIGTVGIINDPFGAPLGFFEVAIEK